MRIIPFSGGAGDPDAFEERAAIHEFEAGMSREDAEMCAAIATRPPTIPEAVEWIKKNQHDESYCRECLRSWKVTMGIEDVKSVFSQSPDAVRKYCEERRAYANVQEALL